MKDPADPGLDAPLEELTYEQAFAQLEGIVSALEEEEQSLEKALSLYERGQALVRFCGDQLDRAELRISQLSDEN
jgi:exodeoxyribonuclease VII small subunit